MPKLTDESLMPFGKHKGVAMANVPAQYLLLLDREGCDNPEVAEYIYENMEILLEEYSA